MIYSFGNVLAGGGIGTTAYRAVSGLNKAGCLKKVICMDAKKTEIPQEKIRKCVPFGRQLHACLEGIRYYIYDAFPSDIIMKELYDRSAMKHVDECDFFYGWSGHSLHSMQKAKALGARTVIGGSSSHPLTQLAILEEEYGRYGIRRMIEHPAVTRKKIAEIDAADFIFAASEFVAKSMAENGVPDEKIIVMPTGADTKRFVPGGKGDGIFRVLFAGTVSLRKGVHYLLDAWSELKLKNSELVLAGAVGKDMAWKLRGLKRVKVMGNVADIAAAYRQASLFVFPSLEEGSAKVTYEAMASGLPIITTFNSGSVVEDGKEGFIIPIRSAKAITEKIRYFYENPGELKRMGARARRKAERYDWISYGKRIAKVLEGL